MHNEIRAAAAVLLTAMTMTIVSQQARAQQPPLQTQTRSCPHADGWRPTAEELKHILAARLFRTADLCNADLNGANLNGANLTSANLNGAQLAHAHLNGADLDNADLNGAILNWADLRGAGLSSANLNGAYLDLANLDGAYLLYTHLKGAVLIGAQLRHAHLNRADLRGARLRQADLTRADLSGAFMRNADLSHATLRSADLSAADLRYADFSNANLIDANLSPAALDGAALDGADLSGADMSGAHLVGTNLSNAVISNAKLDYADLTNAAYAPESEPPNPYVVGIRGISTVHIPFGQEVGLLQLRKLLQDAGLRDEEREATYAIERSTTAEKLDSTRRKPFELIEGVFRLVAFEWTTGYGLYPGRALLLIVVLGGLLTLVYIRPICYPSAQPGKTSGIYQVFPADRIDEGAAGQTGTSERKVARVQATGWKAIRAAAYFSLLSAVNIGFEQFTPGDWIRRLQGQDYTLQAVGWVRVVAGAQALLSVFLLAMWALTYFGRPFQ